MEMFSPVPVSWVHKETHVAGNIGKEEPDPPQTAAKETSSVHILSHSICTPNHVISTVPFIPEGSLMGGKAQELPSSACSIRVEEQRGGCTIPSPSAGQGGHPGFFGTWFCLAWACCCCCSHPTMTSQLPHHCLDVSPSPSPPRHPMLPPPSLQQ